MRLSICIPTHQGRCDVLREALASILAQALQPRTAQVEVEVVVSDNASHDGTEEMVRDLARDAPLPLNYFRNARDLGLQNLVMAVERASGDWCWLFGSDDVMADDALEKLTEVIGRFPDATGIGFWKANYSADLARLLMYEDERIIPPRDEARVVTDPDDVIVDFAFVRMVMSCSAFRRDRWLEAARAHPDAAVEHPDWPQLLIHEEAARRHPAWVWLPAALLKSRTGTAYIIGDGDRGPDMAAVHSRMMSGLHRLWGRSYGVHSVLYRRLMAVAHLSIGSSETVANIKSAPGHRYRSEPRLIVAFVRAFWRLPEFRRGTLRLLLTVGPLWRLRERLRRERLGPPMAQLEPDQVHVRLQWEIPRALPARSMPTVRCRVFNAGSVALTSAGTTPIAVGSRFLDASGSLVVEGVRTWLTRPLEPGSEADLTLKLLTPWDPGTFTLRVAPVQTNGFWADDADSANGVSAVVEIRDAPLPERPESPRGAGKGAIRSAVSRLGWRQ